MEGFGVGPKIYGAIFATLAMGMIGGGQLNHVLVRLYGSHKVFEATIALQTLTGLSFFVGAMFGYLGLFGTMAHLFVILVCAGIGYPNAAAIALEPFSQNAGSAAALLGFLQLGLGSAVSAGVGFLDMKGTLPTALVIAISTCVAIAILLLNRSVTGSIHRPNAIDSSVITH
jgi:DHA1 family bicyclomycin/chloramphenicol resistance-like MFS transporter